MPDDGELLAWCVVANVVAETFCGQGGQDIRHGLKHFSPGTKVWVLPPQWGDGGENVFVIGRHRGRGMGRLARMVVGRHHLTRFRVRGVYSPAVHRELVRPWKHWPDRGLHLWESRETAEQVAHWWDTDNAAQSGVRQPLRRSDLLDALGVCGRVRQWPSMSYAVGQIVALLGTPPDPAAVVGSLLRDQQEADALSRVLDALRPITEEVGAGKSDAAYHDHGRWPEVVAVAAAAHSLLTMPLRG